MRSQTSQTTRFATLLIVLGAASLGVVASPWPSRVSDRVSTPTIQTIARFLESGLPPLTTYRARRHLEASTKGGTIKAQLDAWTNLNPDGTFTFEVVRESGSDLIRGRVLRAALLEEQRGPNRHAPGRVRMTCS
jgi:hypothetical protein